jgi:hypothetical protein
MLAEMVEPIPGAGEDDQLDVAVQILERYEPHLRVFLGAVRP